MKNFVVAALCGSLVSAVVHAAPPAGYEAVGLGGAKCAVWNSWGAQKEDGYKTLRFVAVSWIQGYASGASYAFGATAKIQLHMIPSLTEVEAVTAWMGRYCRANPENSLGAAGQQFVSDLWEKSK